MSDQFDGKKTKWQELDEQGVMPRSKLEERWELNKKALKGKKLKFSKYPSTVGEIFKK